MNKNQKRDLSPDIIPFSRSFLDTLFRVDPSGTILKVSGSDQRSNFSDQGCIVGSKIQDILPSSASLQFSGLIPTVINQKNVSCFEYSFFDKGREYIFEAKLFPLQDGDIATYIRDITERKQAEKALACSQHELEQAVRERTIELQRINHILEQTEKKYRGIFENALEGIYQSTLDGAYLCVNPALATLMGYESPASLLTGHQRYRANAFASRIDFDSFSGQLKSQGQVRQFEYQAVRRDGSMIWLSESARLIDGGESGSPGVEGLVVDISERKRREQAEFECQAAEASTQAKSEFLAHMSHEIRTPITVVRGAVDLLSKSFLTNAQQKYVSICHSSLEHLFSLVNDLLDLSRMEAGKILLENIDVDLDDLLRESLGFVADAARKKDLEIICHVDPLAPQFILGDPVRMKQILANLLTNAVKFTEKGEIVLQVVCDDISCPARSLHFSVSDTGIGIAPEMLGQVFESFTQADSSISRRYGGSGLGLTICKGLAELMNGTVRVESILGQGSTFHFILPLNSTQAAHDHGLQIALEGLRVFVVDGNATHRAMLRSMFVHWGAKVDEAEDLPAVKERIEASSKNEWPYRLVLLDERLVGPGLSDLTLEMKRSFGASGCDVVVMALGGSRFLGSLDGYIPGVTGYLEKPFSRRDLAAIAQAFVLQDSETHQTQNQILQDDLSHQTSSLSLLLVEDSPSYRELLGWYLKNTPHVVDVAVNGEEAVEKYRTGQYDLVFMDIQLPNMDGCAATAKIRDYERQNGQKCTPIIALSVNDSQDFPSYYARCGFTDSLSKKITKSELLAFLDSFLLSLQ